MRILLLLLSVAVLAWLGSGTPIDQKRQLINRPTPDYGREPSAKEHATKGHEYDYFKGQFQPLPLVPRKGEYICGNKLCKLEPGVVPPGCNGMCQYPIL